ncbi:MAG TPA: hypothetical protein PKD99_13200 [Sphingopyxis sp.]|mgnify:CR=1 FL=1|nr:hypothetical protein [Sphingopyxis sp.]HMP46052.1 hypothetical protein [Sphingopyxis sp.]HMQ19735.1 hypothetical protein [Sphingopyxis sp.]
MAAGQTNPQDVFINCRFDPEWTDNFEALAFAVIGCGFRVRCARELDDATGTRIDKLYRIIGESRYGIHDLSCVDPDPVNNLPRFNMPLELGFFLAAKQYGGTHQKEKRCLILESEPYRYQIFVSDLNGMDINPHQNDARTMVRRVRDFLFTASRRKTIPTGPNLVNSYDAFVNSRLQLLADAGLDADELLFADYEKLAIEWIKADASLGSHVQH